MAQNLQIEPKSKDYVVENGSPIPSDRVLEASYIALMIQQGKWLYGEVDQGSQLYTLSNVKRTNGIEQQFASYAEDAIKRNVIIPGKGSAVQATNLATNVRATSNQVSVIPAQTELSSQLNFTPV